MNDLNKGLPRLFTTEQLLEAAGITLANLKEFLRLGLIKPDQPSRGKRQRNFYQFGDVVLAKAVKLMAESGVSRENIHPIAFGAKEIILRESESPLSTQFAPFSNRKGRTLNEYPTKILKLVHYGTFYKVGVQDPVQGSFDYRLIRPGKKLKSISREDLDDVENRTFEDSIDEYADPLTIVVNLTKLHFEVKLKLKGMGLI